MTTRNTTAFRSLLAAYVLTLGRARVRELCGISTRTLLYWTTGEITPAERTQRGVLAILSDATGQATNNNNRQQEPSQK